MNIFYSPHIATSLELTPEESLHCTKVLRMEAGEQIIVVDGKGGRYVAEIIAPHSKHCAVSIISFQQEAAGSKDRRLHIAIAPTKNMDRIEWFVEKATEIGIDEISLLKCRFSERKEVKVERLQKILVSAMKQSLKATLPILNPMTDIKSFVANNQSPLKAIAHCYKENERTLLKNFYKPNEDITILIGPEGDFSQEEVELAIKSGFSPISLGNSRLRTETAALVACHTVCLANE